MAVTGLDHVNIATAKLEETRAFYRDVLGLTEGYRPGFTAPGYWLYAGGRPIIHLQGAPEGEGDGGAVRHFALNVASLPDAAARLDAAGVGYRLTQTPDGVFDQAFFRDPSRAWVELISRRR